MNALVCINIEQQDIHILQNENVYFARVTGIRICLKENCIE